MKEKLLFVTGIQKSGTSLVNRMLMSQATVTNPFLPEGKYFWGDNPPLSPEEEPCGEVYMRYGGHHGHHMSIKDFCCNHREILESKIRDSNIKTPILLNKNPYLVVRLGWLKKVFRQCKVVVMVRNPLSNIYSLSKKHSPALSQTEKGWWGVKPLEWEALIDKDKITQISRQWKSVYDFVVANANHVDLFIEYKSLCSDPNKTISTILGLHGEKIDLEINDLISCMDQEYLIGGSLESRNKDLRKSKNFSINFNSSEIHYPPFDKETINKISSIVNPTWEKLMALVKNSGSSFFVHT